MGREWFDEVARRPGGYSITWRYSIEGPNAQALFDGRILAAITSHPEVLDCGCGDGTFTLEVAKQASRVVGVDYAEGMVELARGAAGKLHLRNVTFIVSHARSEGLFPKGSFDLAYTRRGPAHPHRCADIRPIQRIPYGHPS